MTNRLTRGAGSLAMLWSLVVLGAPAPLADCGMSSPGSSATQAGMPMAHHHHPAPAKHGAPAHAPCCTLTCGCGSFAPLPVPFAATVAVATPTAGARSFAVDQHTPRRRPYSLPFAHAPPLS